MSSASVANVQAARLVLSLSELGRGDLAAAGGKGANLGELVRGGFPVPPGFVVSTAAYDRFVSENGLQDVVTRELARGEGNGATIRDAFERGRIPADLEWSVLEAYREHGGGPVAVRSSATAEDLPEAAFAGQQDTFLNVVGEEALLDAVRRCWASLWSDRAIAYRERQEVDQSSVKLAVVVQQMVMAESAGVMFTANPVTGARDEIVIDASPGLGEAVVAGLVTPDHFVLKKSRGGWRVVERRRGRREVAVQPRAEGGTEHVTLAQKASPRPALPNQALQRLAHLGAEIERHFGGPQDIEWAWAGGKTYIVQARPITALPEPLPRPSRPVRLLAGLMTELLPTRPYPLEVTTWVPTVYGFLAKFGRMLGLRLLPLDQLFAEEDGVVVRLNSHVPFRPTSRILLAPVRLVRQARRYDPARWRADPLPGKALARVRALEARDLRALSWEGLLGTVREAMAIPALIWEFRVRYLIRPMLAAARLRLMLTLLRRNEVFGTLLFTGVETRTLEANRALEALAARIRSDPALADAFARHEAGDLWALLEAQPSGRVFLDELRAFLNEYGHREVGGTMQVSQPTWKDAPEVVLSMLQGLARTESQQRLSQPRALTQQLAWEAARDEVLAHRLMRLKLLRSAFLKLLAEARYFPQLREDTRFYFMLPVPVLRRALLELGRRLAEIGVVDVPEDVFHLKLAELERITGAWPPTASVGELRALVARRKAKRIELENTPLVDPRLLRQTEPEGGALLRGMAGSPGVAEGPVRVVHESAEFGKLMAGDVLVAPYTNPAWTPLFQRAVAVVVDSGSAASHAAIVAREYGIPAVMGTVDGTTKLADGQRVRVDGGRGIVSAVALGQQA